MDFGLPCGRVAISRPRDFVAEADQVSSPKWGFKRMPLAPAKELAVRCCRAVRSAANSEPGSAGERTRNCAWFICCTPAAPSAGGGNSRRRSDGATVSRWTDRSHGAFGSRLRSLIRRRQSRRSSVFQGRALEQVWGAHNIRSRTNEMAASYVSIPLITSP